MVLKLDLKCVLLMILILILVQHCLKIWRTEGMQNQYCSKVCRPGCKVAGDRVRYFSNLKTCGRTIVEARNKAGRNRATVRNVRRRNESLRSRQRQNNRRRRERREYLNRNRR